MPLISKFIKAASFAALSASCIAFSSETVFMSSSLYGSQSEIEAKLQEESVRGCSVFIISESQPQTTLSEDQVKELTSKGCDVFHIRPLFETNESHGFPIILVTSDVISEEDGKTQARLVLSKEDIQDLMSKDNLISVILSVSEGKSPMDEISSSRSKQIEEEVAACLKKIGDDLSASIASLEEKVLEKAGIDVKPISEEDSSLEDLLPQEDKSELVDLTASNEEETEKKGQKKTILS